MAAREGNTVVAAADVDLAMVDGQEATNTVR